jgi:hypothetical protein
MINEFSNQKLKYTLFYEILFTLFFRVSINTPTTQIKLHANMML